jgi:hypothetical protein
MLRLLLFQGGCVCGCACANVTLDKRSCTLLVLKVLNCFLPIRMPSCSIEHHPFDNQSSIPQPMANPVSARTFSAYSAYTAPRHRGVHQSLCFQSSAPTICSPAPSRLRSAPEKHLSYAQTVSCCKPWLPPTRRRSPDRLGGGTGAGPGRAGLTGKRPCRPSCRAACTYAPVRGSPQRRPRHHTTQRCDPARRQ